jgi:alpha-L-rhamnosidase
MTQTIAAMSLISFHRTTAVTGLCCLALLTGISAQPLAPDRGWVESRVSPVGLDSAKPRFSWRLQGSATGLRQTAYQIEVSRPGNKGNDIVWDSGWVESDQSHLVPYAGTALVSSTPYSWRVRVKNEAGTISPWSEMHRWVTGLLDASTELKADWIGYDATHPDAPVGNEWFDIAKASWIAHPAIQKGKDSIANYRTTLELPVNLKRVMIGMEGNFSAQVFVNGIELLQGGRLTAVASYLDITPWVREGANQIAVRLNQAEPRDHSGLIASIRIEKADGSVSHAFTGETWEATLKPVDLWKPTESKEGWVPVKILGKPGDIDPAEKEDAKLTMPTFGNKLFSPPAIYLRKEINLTKPLRFAVFHGTAQGLYDLHANGKRLTPTGMQPGWTQFDAHLSYVSTDVTAALRSGPNAIGAVLADGWFRGNLLWFGRERFGAKTRFSGQLEVEYTDGSRESFATDSTWKASFGPIQQSDILNGEIYDARLEQAGWDQPGFADQKWSPVDTTPRSGNPLKQRAHPTAPVAVEQELKPVSIKEYKPGIYVIDFGQNFAGWTRLKVKGKSGQVIYQRFAEELYPDGSIYTANLRGANPADRYICKGDGLEVWEPRFTYHGFRYVQIKGLTEKPTPDTLIGIVAHSGGPITSTFESSSPMLNRLYQNIQWSQRSNYFETMTDCPQRDERYGWVGDAWFFMATSAYNQNGASFFTKWFLDCVDTQNPKTGNISNGAPGNKPGAGNSQMDWSAAMMVAPWTIWQRYGDSQPIRDNYAALRLYMTQWEKFAKQVNEFEAKGKGQTPYKIIGDWVSIEKGTTREFIGRVLGYLLSKQMADFAEIVGKPEDIRTFTDLAAHFRGEIISKHIAEDGTVTGDTQAAYAYVTRYSLHTPEKGPLLRKKFQERITTDKHGVRTGFHGTGNLLQGLSAIGLPEEAGKNLLNEEFPSWGCMVKRGATTIWEHWDSKNADGSFRSPKMNSFNHYTFGGCGEWMMGYLVGLRNDSPGFKTVRVEPTTISGLDHAAGSFESPYGRISNRWERKNGRITMHLTLPPNCTGLVVLPGTVKGVTKEGKALTTPPTDPIKVASGTHHFTWTE